MLTLKNDKMFSYDKYTAYRHFRILDFIKIFIYVLSKYAGYSEMSCVTVNNFQ